ncbi:MAG TPA: prepilin-type N-terminal cleavage/methylation domain-containing protein [Pyrinomonadaceae bacterium]|nr:prepilin-type N-terminal cleavage/methylation domain-containing protein [Pyrinomonadaceae bacterium]
MKNLKQAGFTLIEMAVALTAISALAAIVLPAVQ